MEEEEDSEGEEAVHEDDDYQPMEEEEAEDDNEEEDVDNRKRRAKRRNATGGDDDGDEDSDDDDVKPVLVKHKKEERMELQEERTQVTGEVEAVTRDSVGALAFKRGGAQRTKEERAERLREVLGRPALALIPEAGDATEADVPAKAGGKGGKAGQVLFREKHRHWIGEANQKDAQGRSRDDPAYDPSTLFIPRKDLEGMNTFQRQYWEIKKQHWDKIIFCRNGVFWELYEKDAEISHRLLDIKLADPGAMGMLTAGVFENAFDPYAAKLIALGYKVVKVEQMQANTKSSEKKNRPKDQAVITRQVTRILSPGTLVDDIYIDDERAIYLLAVKEKWEPSGDSELPSYGVCFVDTATGEVNVGQFQDDRDRTQFETLLLQIKPREILYEKEGPTALCSPQTLQLIKRNVNQPTLTRRRPGDQFWNASTTADFLAGADYFAGGDREWPPVLSQLLKDHREAREGSELCLSAFGGVVSYLKELYLDKEVLAQGRIKTYAGTTFDSPNLVLDSKTIKNLEIFENTVDGKTEGTLLKLMDHCSTPFGKRLFKRWLAMPLKRIHEIEERQNAVEDFNGSEDHSTTLKDAVALNLKGLPDLERIVSRIHAGSSPILTFLSALDAFDLLWNMVNELQPLIGQLRSKRLAFLLTVGKGFPDIAPQLEYFSRAFDRDQAKSEQRLILRPGVDEEFDAAREKVETIEQQLQQHLEDLKEEVGISDMAYATVRNKEYLIEIPRTPKNEAAIKRHKSTFIPINDTKSVGRYWTPTISALFADLEKARTDLERCRLGLFARNQQKFSENHREWSLAVACMAEVDCLHSLAITSSSLGEPVCRPTFVEAKEAFFEAEEMRHPCISPKIGDEFIPNTLRVGHPHQPLILLTGPNMGGKSTLLRETCVLAIIAQVGCFVPAASCRLSPVDRIFTRIGANDNIMAGQSTFMIELQETASILQHATPASLVILDELGRGTATFDGYSIAYAVLEHLSRKVGCRTLFSTHYHMLTDEVVRNPHIALKHMSCHIDDDRKEVTFLYKVADGVCPKSYGMNVARMAGVNEEIVASAEKIAQKFEGELAIDLQLMETENSATADDDDSSDATTHGAAVGDDEVEAKSEAVSADEKARVEEIAHLLREEEEKGVAGRMAAFARLVGLWTQATQ